MAHRQYSRVNVLHGILDHRKPSKSSKVEQWYCIRVICDIAEPIVTVSLPFESFNESSKFKFNFQCAIKGETDQ